MASHATRPTCSPNMQTIHLNKGEWCFDESQRLGKSGGFGDVFKGSGVDGPVAVKRLKLTAEAAAHRELRIGEELAGRNLSHVVPVLDCGQDALSDQYFVVMPICETSLQDKLDREGPPSNPELRGIVANIIAGLSEIGDLVHRDLKPANILFFDGRWRIADFGIAKFVDESTSLQTLSDCLTPQYAAPEQWRRARATQATDVYALGCTIHALVTGSPPFHGSVEELRDGHENRVAPALSFEDSRLVGLVSQMLRKEPLVRPSLARCGQVVSSLSAPQSQPYSAVLNQAAAYVSANEARKESEIEAASTKKKADDALAREATTVLDQVRASIFAAVTVASADAKVLGQLLEMGSGSLLIGLPIRMNSAPDGAPNRPHSGWDVRLFSTLEVRRKHRPAGNIPVPPNRNPNQPTIVDPPYVWSATLAFAATPHDKSYRWREIAFFRSFAQAPSDEPFAIRADSPDFDTALSNVLSRNGIAIGPNTIDAEDEAAFQDRLIWLLSKAAVGSLQRPNAFPILPNFFS